MTDVISQRSLGIPGLRGTEHIGFTVPDLEAAVQDADVVILLQSHSSYDLARLSDVASSLLDTRGVVPETSAVHRL